MSVQQSNITDLNYDLVLGASQKSINGIMKTYYSNAADYFLEQTWYFLEGMPIDRTSFSYQTNGMDPFEWDGQGTMPAQIQAGINAGFTCAFKFIPGDPGNPAVGSTPATYPAWDYNYLTYLPNETFYGQTYNYILCCQNLQVVCWNPYTNTWTNYTQPVTPNSPASSIIKFAAYATLGSQSKPYSANDYKSPQDVRTQAAALHASNISFTIQQLVLNLDAMSPSTEGANLPFMHTVDQFYYTLTRCFISAYAGALKSSFKDVPTLCYTLPQTNQTNRTVINPTHVQTLIENYVDANGNVVSNPTADQASLSTVNYFCTINGNTPVTPQQFKWNWLDSDNDESSYDGAVALSKYAFGGMLYNQLLSYVQNNCWVPQINCNNSNGTDAWSFSMTSNGTLNTDALIANNSSNVLMVFWYHPAAFTTYGAVNTGDYVTITPQFQLEVEIKDASTITVAQTSTFAYTIKIGGGEAMVGEPLNIQYTQDYGVIVQPDGTLDFAPGELSTWGGPSNELIPYLSNAEGEQMVQSINKTVASMQSTDLTATPLGNLQQFVLPGGNAFMFKNAQFTAKNDLACEITYLKTIL